MEKLLSEEELQQIEDETGPLLKEAERSISRRFTSTLDMTVIGLSIAMGIDSIAAPILTGTTIHELFGMPPKSNYQIYPHISSLIAEQGMFFISMFYNTAMAWYKRERNQY